MNRHLHKNTKHLVILFILVPMLLVTVAALSQPLQLLQFAQDTFSSPPIYGCLQVGEGNKTTCASQLGITTAFSLTLHDRPLSKETEVYYGDRVKGSIKFTNVGDLPITLNNMGLTAIAKEKNLSRDFEPLKGKVVLPPKESASLNNTTYKFKSPDPNKSWTISSKITTPGGEIPTADSKLKITVNATCTALRIKELTTQDKNNIKTLCGKNPKSKLCTSREYCEIFKGTGCTQPNLYVEKPGWQCDQNVYLPAPEQEILEELCKVYPDTEACKKFCERSAGSSLCPRKYIVVNTTTGKPVLGIRHPKAVYVHDANSFPIDYPADYLSKGFPKAGDQPKPSPKVLGEKTSNSKLLAKCTGPMGVCYPGETAGPAVPAPPARPAGPIVPPPAPGALAPGGPGTLNTGGRTGNACPPGTYRAGPGDCIAGPGGPAKPAPVPPIAPGNVPPPAGLTNGAPPPLPRGEPSSFRPAPGQPGKVIDKNGNLVNIPGTLKPNANPGRGNLFPCQANADPANPNTQLCTDPTIAEQGDEGYAPQCGSGRQDVLEGDDRGGPEHSCCLEATKYVPGGGFCGRKAGAYLVPAGTSPKDRKGPNPCTPTTPGGPIPPNCVETDYFGRVCANSSWTDPDSHICKGEAAGDREGDINRALEQHQNSPEGKPFKPMDEKGFPRGTANPSCSGPDRHTIALPDGAGGQKNGTCVLNTQTCPSGQYQPVGGQCTDYCPPGQIVNSDGACRAPGTAAPGQPGAAAPASGTEGTAPPGDPLVTNGTETPPADSEEERACRALGGTRTANGGSGSSGCRPVKGADSAQCARYGLSYSLANQRCGLPEVRN